LVTYHMDLDGFEAVEIEIDEENDSDYCEECEENDDEMTTYSIYTEYFWSDPTFN